MGPGLLGGLLGAALALSGACDPRGPSSPENAACPACVCTCEDGGATARASTSGGTARRDCPACVCECEGPGAGAGASEASQERLDAALREMNHDDGAGCLSELDGYDRIEVKRRSSDPQNPLAMTRAQCLMLAGQCEPGKELLRGVYQNLASMNRLGPEQTERAVEMLASMHCRGDMSPRDQLLQGMMTLSTGAHTKRMSVGECEDAYQKVRRNRETVRPRDDEDPLVIAATRSLYGVAPGCFARAGDCVRARTSFDETFPLETLKDVKDPKARAEAVDATFVALLAKCKG